MNKLITLLRAPPSVDKRKFQEWYISEYAPRDAASRPSLTIVNVSRIDRDQENPPYDLLIETWPQNVSSIIRVRDLRCR